MPAPVIIKVKDRGKIMTQKDRVLQYMQDFGFITSLDAFKDLGITRLSAKIYELRKEGYTIGAERLRVRNRYGDYTHFNKYYLADERDELSTTFPQYQKS